MTSAAPARSNPTHARHVYDVVVIGGQLGGAVAGALLAKRGYRTLVVEHDGTGGGYEHSGYLLPYAPFIAPPLKSMPLAEEVLSELGLNTEVQRGLRSHTPNLQLISEQHRLDLPREPDARVKELRREFDDSGSELERAFQIALESAERSTPLLRERPSLHPAGLLDRLALSRAVKRHPGVDAAWPAFASDELQRLVEHLHLHATYCHRPAGLARVRPTSLTLAHPCSFQGGREGIRELVFRRIVDLGGTVLDRERAQTWVAEGLVFDGKQVSGVRVVNSDNDYRSKAVIAATDAGAIRRLVPDKRRHRDLVELLDQLEPQRFLLTVNWVVPNAVLPRGLGELAVVEPDDATLGPLLVQKGPCRQSTGKPVEDQSVVCAGIFVATSARELGEENLRSLVEQLNRQLDRLLPFARAKAQLVSSPQLDAQGVRGSRLVPHPLYSQPEGTLLGVTGIPTRTPVKNLFLAGREVLPGLGLEGEFLSGKSAAEAVQALLHKTRPLKR